MMKLKLLVLSGGMFASISLHAEVSEVCPAISCDCTSLPKAEWQATCADHEKQIKKRCAANKNKPMDYCSIHGPMGTPLPLAMRFTNVAVLPEKDVTAAHKSLDGMYASVHADLATMKKKASSLSFKEALQLAKTLDETINRIFETERQVAMSWLVYEQQKDAVGAWRSYAGDSLDMAEQFTEFADEMWQAYGSENHDGAKKAYKILAFKVWRLAGKAHEMSAYSYAGANKSKKAAKAWSLAADISKVVLAAKQSSKAKLSHINFYRFQAASRLHRASYHFSVTGDSEEALKMLSAANDVSPGDELLALIELEENQEAAELTNSGT